MVTRLKAEIPPEFEGQRLDRALAQLFPDESRSSLARLVEHHLVLVDGIAAERRSRKVSAGEVIELELPDPQPSDVIPQDLPLSIVYQDADIAIIDKPAGLVVHPASGHADSTLVNALLHHVTDLSGIGGELRPGIVHRLDKDTSGLMVVAKNDAAHKALTSAWNTQAVVKEYLALVYGTPRTAGGAIDQPIGRDPRDRKKMGIVASGRRAVTEWELVEKLPHSSLLRCRLRTGRTHQIRVHLRHLGHPVVGDPAYSGPQWHGITDKRIQRIFVSMKRQALHAAMLRLPHPSTGESMTFTSPLPDDMRDALAALHALC